MKKCVYHLWKWMLKILGHTPEKKIVRYGRKWARKLRRYLKGFTLVELLVSITVIGIMSSMSVVMFNGYYAKAHDSQRVSDLTQVSKLLKTAAISKGVADYIRDEAEMREIIEAADFELGSGAGNICYFIGMSEAVDDIPAEYAIATWGLTKSTKDEQKEGVIVYGTRQAVINLSEARINDQPSNSLLEEDFYCDNSDKFNKVYRAFTGDTSFN